MAISLGDVNFGVGADVTNLQRSISALQNFGRVVDTASAASDRAAAALRRQEKAAVDALVKVQNLTNAMQRVQGSERFVNTARQAYDNFNRTMTSGVQSTLAYQRAQEQLKVSLAGVNRGFRDHSIAAQGALGSNSRLVEGLRSLQAAAVITTGPLGGVASRVMAFTSVVKVGGFAVASFVAGIASAAAGMYSLASAAAAAGAQMKGFESSLKAVTGSTAEGMREVETAIKIARSAGTLISDTVPAYTKFTAAAEGTVLQGEKAQKIFTTLAKVTSILNMTADSTAGSFKAIEQMISKGTVQAEELRGQLGDRLPGAFQIAARAMGVTTEKLGDMMKKGEVMAVDLLPKLEAELRKTFNLDEGPIDTYVASINNMWNAWNQLLVSIDKKFNITGKIQLFAETATYYLDMLRVNLDEVVAKAAIYGSLLATVFGSFTLGVPLAIAAIWKFGDEIRVFQDEAGTLKSYMDVLWTDITSIIDTGSADAFSKMSTNWEKNKGKVFEDAKELGKIFEQGVKDASKYVDSFLNEVLNGMRAAWNGLVAMWPELPNAIASGVIEAMNIMIQAVNSGLGTVAAALNSVIDGMNAISGIVGGGTIDFKIDLNIPEIENQYSGAGAKASAAFDAAWSDAIQNPKDYMGALNDSMKMVNGQTDKYLDSVRERANLLGAEAEINKIAGKNVEDMTRWEEARTAEVARRKKLEDAIAFNASNAEGGEGKGKKGALERKAQAIADMEEALKRVDEEIDALGGSEAGLKQLNEEFKRRDEVEKYAKALRKAGVDTDYVTQKTGELYEKLKQRDALQQAQEGMKQWSDALSQSVDFLGNSLVDLAFEGKDAFKSIGDAAKALAKDITNTFIQLSLTNPLKNLIFGQSNPTLGSGNGFGNILGSLFGGLGGTSFNPLTASPGLWRKGGVSPISFGQYDKAANGMITKPTFLDTPGGVIQAGEAGTEAIMPLARDSSGSLGVRANLSGGGGNVQVNVYAPEGSSVSKQQSTNQQGDSIIDIIIEQAKQAVAGDIASGGTGLNKAMEGRYGLAASSGLRK